MSLPIDTIYATATAPGIIFILIHPFWSVPCPILIIFLYTYIIISLKIFLISRAQGGTDLSSYSPTTTAIVDDHINYEPRQESFDDLSCHVVFVVILVRWCFPVSLLNDFKIGLELFLVAVNGIN